MRAPGVLAKIAAFFPRFRWFAPRFREAIVALSLLCACSAGNDLALLPLRSMEIDEDAAILYVAGEGFVHGARCEVLLEGTAHPLGKPQEQVSLEAPCRVLTDERAMIALSEPVLRDRARGFFEGSLTLRLSSGENQRAVSGTLEPVRLRLGTYGRDAVDDALSIARAARAFQHQVGLVGAEASARGVLVTALREDGTMARAGVLTGDLVQRVNGAPVEEPDDLLVPAHAARARLGIVRRGQGQLELSLPLEAREPVAPTALFVAALLAFVLAALLPAYRFGTPNAHRVLVHLPWLAGSLALSFASMHGTGEFDAGLLWLASLVAHAVTLLVAHARNRRSAVDLARDALDGALATLCVATLLLLAGSMRVPLLADLAAASALETALVGTPAGLCACLGLCWVLAPRNDGEPVTLPLLRASAALLCVVLGFGAGNLPSALGLAHGLGFALVGLTGLALAAGLAMALTLSSRRNAFATVFAPLGVALALLQPVWADHVPAELGNALVLGFLLGRAARSGLPFLERAPQRDPALSPFL